MENFIYKYYIEPITTHSGYNPVNTVTYAVIALAALYFLFTEFRKRGITIDKKFVYSVVPFVLLGSTVRVVTDAIDAGRFLPITPIHDLILKSHIYDYGFLTVSPGIYLVVAAILLVSLAILKKLNRTELLPYVGLALWIPHLLLILPFIGSIGFAAAVLILAIIPAIITLRLFKNNIYALMVGAQALDGAATFVIIDFGKVLLKGAEYGEQHVASGLLGEIFGTYATFYLVKVAISMGAAYLLTKEEKEKGAAASGKGSGEDELLFVAMIIMIMGLAPGLRDVLRAAVGA